MSAKTNSWWSKFSGGIEISDVEIPGWLLIYPVFFGKSPLAKRSETLELVRLIILPVALVLYLLGWVLYQRLARQAAATSRWHRLPTPLALATILIYRNRLRRENLYDTESSATRERPVPAPEGARHLTARTADGTYNDLNYPRMGSAGTRFGRNVPIERTFPDYDRLIQPNPRTVSR